MPYCEKKGLYCSQVGKCEQATDSCDLPDCADKEIIFSAEDLERICGETAEAKELKSFDKLIAELTESGTKLIKDYHEATKSCEDLQKEVYNLRAELKATRALLEAFEQGSMIAPELQDKLVSYLTDLAKKPISRKTAIDKIIKWVKNDCR
jgi:cell division protein FtsB